MNQDVIVFILVVAGFLAWGMIAFRRWLYEKPFVKVPESKEAKDLSDEAAELLRKHGYDVIHGKWKVQIKVHVDERELGSSLFIDYFAKRGSDVYAVKVAKSRKPIDLTVGSTVREHLLPYALLYEETAGVLYVDTNQRKIYQIRFALEL